MNEEEALLLFLENSLSKRWKDRYLSFAANNRTRSKFLNSIYHDLGSCFKESVIVDNLRECSLCIKAFSFKPPDLFGICYGTLQETYEMMDDACLVVSENGKYGFYRQETFIDSELLLSV